MAWEEYGDAAGSGSSGLSSESIFMRLCRLDGSWYVSIVTVWGVDVEDEAV